MTSPAPCKACSKAGELNPQSPEPIAWRAAIHMVQAQLPAKRCPNARGWCRWRIRCMRKGCTAYVQASTGHLARGLRGA